MTELTLVEAIQTALARALAEDANVMLLGEDIGRDGGVFRATDGLIDRFGAKRVRDTPLSEATIAGVSVGLATQGFRPVAEIQFMGFIYPAIDQLLNHAGRLRTRTRGRLACPLVVRAPYGAGIRAPEHHSESTEALFCHIPGLRVVIPSSPARGYGLLLSAIRDPDPVVFLEPKRIYRSTREEICDDGTALPLDRGFILRAGQDVTLISWGAMISETLAAAERLSADNIDCEVIDLATLKPFDKPLVLESVSRTGRCVIVHEAALTGGFGGEIAASIADEGLFDLLAPIKRVAGFDTIVPMAKLEDRYLVSGERIRQAVQEVMKFS